MGPASVQPGMGHGLGWHVRWIAQLVANGGHMWECGGGLVVFCQDGHQWHQQLPTFCREMLPLSHPHHPPCPADWCHPAVCHRARTAASAHHHRRAANPSCASTAPSLCPRRVRPVLGGCCLRSRQAGSPPAQQPFCVFPQLSLCPHAPAALQLCRYQGCCVPIYSQIQQINGMCYVPATCNYLLLVQAQNPSTGQ